MGSHFKVLARISCLSLVFLFCALQGVEASFYEDKARGWFWYEDPFLEAEEDDVRTIKKENLLPESLPVEPNYGEQLQRYKKSLEDKKAKALMSPTYSHVKDYMIAQKDMSDRASFFSEQWKRVVLTTPALNPEIDNPTSHYISHVKKDEERMARQAELASMAKTYGLFLFVSHNCAYCKAFAPVVKKFAEAHGFEVIVISLQGSVDADIEALFPTIWNNNGIAETFGIQQAPALMAYSKNDDDLIPITYGATSLDTLATNALALIHSEKKASYSDYNSATQF